MPRIDPEDLHRTRLRYELEFLERELEGAVPRMRLNIGIELGRRESPAQHITLELGHVDAVSGEAAERLVERGRNVAHLEDEGGHDLAAARLGPARRARQHDEARGVVRRVLDIAP